MSYEFEKVAHADWSQSEDTRQAWHDFIASSPSVGQVNLAATLALMERRDGYNSGLLKGQGIPDDGAACRAIKAENDRLKKEVAYLSMGMARLIHLEEMVGDHEKKLKTMLGAE